MTSQPRSLAEYRRPRIAVVVSGWPRVSETFALNELLALRRHGMLAAVVATKPGDAALVQPGAEALDVTVLPDGDAAAQGAALAALLAPDRTGNRGADSGRRIDAIHGYFAHRPAEIARVAAEQLGIPFGFSVHALDARKVAADVLAERSRAARIVVACNADVAATVGLDAGALHLQPHGVDLDRFTPPTSASRCSPGPLRILAVGRLVAKKGFEVLLEAIAAMTEPVSLRIIGDGPRCAALRHQALALGIADRVCFSGRLTHTELPAAYQAADVVAVPSVIDEAGDRDGLPNVVLEAMASGRAIVASDVAAIATAVIPGVTGLLIPPGDSRALAVALDTLAGDPTRRHALGEAGRSRATDLFDLTTCSTSMCHLLETAYA